MPILKNSELSGSSSTSDANNRNVEKRASFSVTDNLQEGSNAIKVKKHKDENIIDVFIGFIQVFHRYGIKFSFSLPGFGTSITYKTDYAQLEVKKLAMKDSIVTMGLEYLPGEEKVGSIIETLTVGNDKGDMEMVLFLHMEVLGRTQGRPSLKDGVTCLETLPEYKLKPKEWAPTQPNENED